jgi:galactose mutarotase-like enzyme
MPAGLGLHPWFVGAVRVGLEADAVYPTNSGSPPRPEPVDATRFDLRSSPDLPDGLDATWSSLRRSSVQLAWPEAGIAAELEIRTSAAACVAVATPADPDATAVEPQTHGPDGLRRLVLGEPDPLSLLAPGASLRLDLRLRVRRTTGAGAVAGS